jgi:hypothetical protein
MRVRRAATSGVTRRRWEKSRDADEPYLDEQSWDRIWANAVAESGIPFKPTAYQVRHTHASWLIDAGENPKAVMHRLGQADLRTTARYVHVLDETGVGRQAVRGAIAAAVTPKCADLRNMPMSEHRTAPSAAVYLMHGEEQKTLAAYAAGSSRRFPEAGCGYAVRHDTSEAPLDPHRGLYLDI